jgi:hypothetical protein
LHSQHLLRDYFRDVVKDPKYRKTVYDCVQKDLANAKSWLRRQRKNANYHWHKSNNIVKENSQQDMQSDKNDEQQGGVTGKKDSDQHKKDYDDEIEIDEVDHVLVEELNRLFADKDSEISSKESLEFQSSDNSIFS